jgi:hypothetical protein
VWISLFTEARGRSILGTLYTALCIGSRYSDRFDPSEHTVPRRPITRITRLDQFTRNPLSKSRLQATLALRV